MTAQRHIIVLEDMNKKTCFINDMTGVKLVVEIEENVGTLKTAEITEADVKRAFEENGVDISHLKGLNPTKSEIELFRLFIQEYIKQNQLFDGRIKKFE